MGPACRGHRTAHRPQAYGRLRGSRSDPRFAVSREGTGHEQRFRQGGDGLLVNAATDQLEGFAKMWFRARAWVLELYSWLWLAATAWLGELQAYLRFATRVWLDNRNIRAARRARGPGRGASRIIADLTAASGRLHVRRRTRLLRHQVGHAGPWLIAIVLVIVAAYLVSSRTG